MKYVKGIPSMHGEPFVYVYSPAAEGSKAFSSEVNPKHVAYGVLLPHREKAPEWMHAKLSMLDLAADDNKPVLKDDDGIPGIGYKGSIWYVIYDGPKYAIEAGLDVSDLNAAED